MGQVQDKVSKTSTALQDRMTKANNAYQEAMRRLKESRDHVQAAMGSIAGEPSGPKPSEEAQPVTGGYFGGGEGKPGKGLKEYRMSLASATKDRIIRGLARSLKNAGIDVNPDGSAEEIVESLKKNLPNPKHKKTFKQDAETHKKVCTVIANVLNDEFTPNAPKKDRLIDTSLGPVAICRQVSEIVHSMATGLHTEFLDVYADLTRTLRNVKALRPVIDKLIENIMEQISKAPDLGHGSERKIGDYRDVLGQALKLLDQQILKLEGYLGVKLATAQKELEIAVKEEGETYDLVKSLKLIPGTKEFSDALARVVSGLGTIASISAQVDKALKEVGMDAEEYVRSAGFDELQKKLDDKMFEGKVARKDVGKFLEAVATLKENFGRRSELDLKRRGEPRDDQSRGDLKRGGEPESKLDRRIEALKSERKLIEKDFVGKVSRHYDRLLKAVQEMGPELGRSIPLSDKLEQLRNALARLGQSRLGGLDIEFSLVGLHVGAEAREKKQKFVSDMRMVVRILDELMGMQMYSGSKAAQYLGEMRGAIDSLLRTIDFFTDVVAKKYGGEGDFSNSGLNNVDSGLNNVDSGVTGGSPLPQIARSSYDLNRAVNTFLYFYFVAKVRGNLKQSHKELEVYGEKYDSILGDAVAARLRQLQADKTTRLASLSENVKEEKAARDMIDAEFDCKAKFYKALQALDLYMKAFTEGIVANPDDVKDIKRILDGVQVIGRWYVESTGDDLAKAFDLMPYGYTGDTPQYPDVFQKGTVGHYYEKVAAATNRAVGNPNLVVPPTQGEKVQKEVGNVYDNFQALKNIVNAFVRVGDRFGGKELRRRVFMSPTQIYKSLLDYLKNSALSVGDIPRPLPEEISNIIPAKLVKTGVYFSNVVLLPGTFATEDKYFSFCVKAMAAKILTVLGVYDLFERPSPVYELTPTRMIIGGGDYDAPEVIPEAMELYFRLPRLAEFYKSLFGWDESSTAAAKQISMLPDVEGIYSGLIRLIFMSRTAGGVFAVGDYSDTEVQAVVREVNAIYNNFRGSDDAISKALNGFVMEINRRYGIIKKSEWDAYNKLLKESRLLSTPGATTDNLTNYAILPDEDEYEVTRAAPSDRFAGLGTAAASASLPSGEFEIDTRSGGFSQWTMLKKFRERLDGYFANIKPNDFTTFTYSTVIRQAELEARRASDNAKRLDIVARLVQGSGSLTGVDVNKAFMFHETVVVGLNALNAMYTVLRNVGKVVEGLNVQTLRKQIIDNIRAGQPIATGVPKYLLADGTLLAGVAGAAAGSVAQLRINVNAASTDAAKQTVAIYSLDNQKIMGDLLVMVTALTSSLQGLVQVRFPNTATSQLLLDFSKLRGLIQALMSDVKYFMDLFRPFIDKAIVDKYESKNNVGSVYWLEEKLVDEMIRGKPGTTGGYLDDVSRAANDTFTTLVGYQRYSLAGLTAAGLTVNDGGDANQAAQYYLQFGNLMSKIVFYDAGLANSGVVGSAAIPLGTAGLDGLVATERPRVNLATGAVAAPVRPGNFRLNLWNAGAELNENRSLLFSFNQLLAKYLSQFYDTSTGKMYRNLIDSFANGTLSQAVMSPGNSLPDVVTAAGTTFRARGDPKTTGILFQSLALIMQRLVSDMNPSTQISDHMVGTLTEIPLYIRENYRANLPAFMKLFTLVQKEGELMKQVVSQTSIRLDRRLQAAPPNAQLDDATGYVPAALVSVNTFGDSPLGSDQVRQVVVSLIDAVSTACYAVTNAAAEVMRELADTSPLYLETQQNSIQEYKARYGKLPLMPLSSALTYFNDNDNQVGGVRVSKLSRQMPVHTVGNEDFKLMYGTRKLLGNPSAKVTLSDTPGVRANLDNYNSTAASGEKIDVGRYETFLGDAVNALRFVVDTRYSRAALAPVNKGLPLRYAVALPAATGGVGDRFAAIITQGTTNAVYQVLESSSTMTTLAVTESSMQEQEMKKISDTVGGAAPTLGGDRKTELIMNVIDMNIIPVNVHALMRGIPLAPIYNYVYTFEQMACLMFGETVEHIDQMAPADFKNTRQMYLKLLLDPYDRLSTGQYGNMEQLHLFGANGLVQRIFRGDDTLLMGRPKFLSDQMYNKALFGSLMVPNPDGTSDYDETGPRGTARVAVGRDTTVPLPTIIGFGTYTESPTTLPGAPQFRRVAGERGDTLTFIKKSDSGDNTVGRVSLTRLNTYERVGVARFDTRLVRNLFFISNVQRLIRLKLDQELTQYRNVLVSNHSVVNPGVTEFGYLPATSERDVQSRRLVGPLETSGDRRYDSDTRLLE